MPLIPMGRKIHGWKGNEKGPLHHRRPKHDAGDPIATPEGVRAIITRPPL